MNWVIGDSGVRRDLVEKVRGRVMAASLENKAAPEGTPGPIEDFGSFPELVGSGGGNGGDSDHKDAHASQLNRSQARHEVSRLVRNV
jgi:hypothetical protein